MNKRTEPPHKPSIIRCRGAARHQLEQKGKCPYCKTARLARFNNKQRKIAHIKKAKIERRTISAQTYITQARLFFRDFIKCWHCSREGNVLPRESLPELQSLLDRAKIMTGNRVSADKVKAPVN